jgi:hypothetical protein
LELGLKLDGRVVFSMAVQRVLGAEERVKGEKGAKVGLKV